MPKVRWVGENEKENNEMERQFPFVDDISHDDNQEKGIVISNNNNNNMWIIGSWLHAPVASIRKEDAEKD